jgi:hypothetical protein
MYSLVLMTALAAGMDVAGGCPDGQCCCDGGLCGVAWPYHEHPPWMLVPWHRPAYSGGWAYQPITPYRFISPHFDGPYHPTAVTGVPERKTEPRVEGK